MSESKNPNHPVCRGLDGQWHKILAFVIFKYRKQLGDEVTITIPDMRAFFDAGYADIVAQDGQAGLRVRIVTAEHGDAIASEHSS